MPLSPSLCLVCRAFTTASLTLVTLGTAGSLCAQGEPAEINLETIHHGAQRATGTLYPGLSLHLLAQESLIVGDLRGHCFEQSNGWVVSDSDGSFTRAEHEPSGRVHALDAYYASEVTLDFLSSFLGRDGWDGESSSLSVFVNDCIDSDGQARYEGQGRVVFEVTNPGEIYPATYLDVVAHEIFHAITHDELEWEEVLGSTGDSPFELRGLSEGLSDIFSAAVQEYHNQIAGESSNDIWTYSRHPGNDLRSLADPKAYGHADTYQGQFFPGSVAGYEHELGTVVGHWAYLVAEGSALTDGINDHGDTFYLDDDGVEILGLADYLYRMLKSTIHASEGIETETAFRDFRDASLSGVDFDPLSSTGFRRLATAWYAVGLFGRLGSPSGLSVEQISSSQYELTWTIPEISHPDPGFWPELEEQYLAEVPGRIIVESREIKRPSPRDELSASFPAVPTTLARWSYIPWAEAQDLGPESFVLPDSAASEDREYRVRVEDSFGRQSASPWITLSN